MGMLISPEITKVPPHAARPPKVQLVLILNKNILLPRYPFVFLSSFFFFSRLGCFWTSAGVYFGPWLSAALNRPNCLCHHSAG